MSEDEDGALVERLETSPKLREDIQLVEPVP